MVDEVPITYREEMFSTNDADANDCAQQGLPKYNASRPGHTGPFVPFEPPTYDEAVMSSINERLANEKELMSAGRGRGMV